MHHKGEHTLDSYAADVGRRLDEIPQQAYEHTASVAPATLRDVERSRLKRYSSVNVDADDLDLIWCMDRSALGQVIDKKDPSVLQSMAFTVWSFWNIVFQHTR